LLGLAGVGLSLCQSRDQVRIGSRRCIGLQQADGEVRAPSDTERTPDDRRDNAEI
jgi:hypothetical protein